MSARRIISGRRERDTVTSGRFIAHDKNSCDISQAYSRNAAIVTVDSSHINYFNNARSVNDFNYRPLKNYAKTGCSFEWLTDSETGTPDFQSPDSDSSTGSLLSKADAAAAKKLSEEWEKLERTLYDEGGVKVTQKHLIEECEQWRELFPHLRVIGRQLILKNGPLVNGSDSEELLYHSLDNNSEIQEQFLSSRYSPTESSVYDYSNYKTTPFFNDETNIHNNYRNHAMLLTRKADGKKFFENENITKLIDQKELEVSLNSLLHITPLKLTNSSDMYRAGPYSSILRSEISSSKWRRNVESPNYLYSHAETESSLPILEQNSHNSAKPVLIPEKHKNSAASLSAGESRTSKWQRAPNTAVYKNRERSRLQPIGRPLPLVENVVPNPFRQLPKQQVDLLYNTPHKHMGRKVSLPPIHMNDVVSTTAISLNSGISASRSSRKKPQNPMNVIANRQDLDFDSNSSILRVFESEQRRSRGKHLFNGNKSFEKY